jgi:subtilisin family serine protease
VRDYIAVAAPGSISWCPRQTAYQITTGTSIAAAEASGLAALMIERDPKLKQAGVPRVLTDTAKDLGPTGHDRISAPGSSEGGIKVTPTCT